MVDAIQTRSHDGALRQPADSVDDYLRALAAAIDGLSRDDIWTAADLLVSACRQGRRIYLVGNGGSASTASHIANDLNKQAIVPGQPRFRAIALTENVPLLTAWGNDESFRMVFRRQLENHLEEGDVLIAISTSGESPNILEAVGLARERGAVTIGLSGDGGGPLRPMVDLCILVPSAEIGHQEAVHLALDHVITMAIRQRIDPPR